MHKKTLAEQQAELNRAVLQLGRVIADVVIPEMQRLTESIHKLMRALYLARLRRMIPFFIAALVVGLAIGWWVSA